MSRLSHQNVCSYFGVFETENTAYVIVELLGVSLMQFIQRIGLPSEAWVQTVMRKLIKAVDYLEKRGIVHRDLKLENIMLKNPFSQNPEPVIIDFGLSEWAHGRNVTYIRCGTPGYISPEVLNHHETL